MINYDNKQERTLVAIKPDGVQRGLIGEVIRRYETCGLKLVALKMIIANKDQMMKHYSVDPEWALKTGTKSIESYKSKGLIPPTEDPIALAEAVRLKLVNFMTSGPIVIMIWQGMNAISIVRKITGSTEPLSSTPGTIRGDYTIDSYTAADIDQRAVRNIIHASGSIDEANKEIAVWFTPEEILNYRLVSEAVIYDVNMDGILE